MIITCIFEFADIINKNLRITRYANQDSRFTCSFDGAEIIDRMSLVSMFGEGSTIDNAIRNYCTEIAGRILVFNACSGRRSEFKVPANIGLKP